MKKKQKSESLPFCPESETVDVSQFRGYMNENMPHKYETVKKMVLIKLVRKVTFVKIET